MLFDPLDKNYLYMATAHEVRRIKVAECNAYTTCEACLSALDPYCGWCPEKKLCTFQSECQNWMDASENSEKCPRISVSPRVISVSTQDKSSVFFVTAGGNLPDISSETTCQLKRETGKLLCSGQSRGKSFKNCSCTVTGENAFQEDYLKVEASIKFGTLELSDSVELFRCSGIERVYRSDLCLKCVEVGCQWHAEGHVCQLRSSAPSAFTVSDKDRCPQIATVEKITPNDTSNATIFVTLLNANVIQTKTLSCKLGKGDLITAEWINQTTIKCFRAGLQLDALDVPLDVVLFNDESKKIDNPKNVSGKVCFLHLATIRSSYCRMRILGIGSTAELQKYTHHCVSLLLFRDTGQKAKRKEKKMERQTSEQKEAKTFKLLSVQVGLFWKV
nr:PREDICTED: plexin-D1-like [Latimeria chalumnae]|eukprot:XP_014341243.1 PREDICTED: plexin-D1-like [Latimeria chalumnae]